MTRFVYATVLVVFMAIGSIQCDEQSKSNNLKDVSMVDNAIRLTADVESFLAMHGIGTATEKHTIQKRQLGGLVSSSAQANAVNHRPGLLGLGLGSRVANSGVQSLLGRLPGGRLGVSAANSAAQGFQLGPGGLSGVAAQSGSQSLSLGNRRINIAHSNGFSLENGIPSLSRGSSLSLI